MNTYYIRAIESDWAQVIALGEMLGVLSPTSDGKGIGGGWVYIGPIYRPTGATAMQDGVEVNVKAPLKDAQGSTYIHANLIMDGSLRELAASKALENPEIAEALQEIPRFFVTDISGQAIAPANPERVVFQL